MKLKLFLDFINTRLEGRLSHVVLETDSAILKILRKK